MSLCFLEYVLYTVDIKKLCFPCSGEEISDCEEDVGEREEVGEENDI